MGVSPSVDGKGGEDGVEEEPPRTPASRTTRSHLICLARAHNKFAVMLQAEFSKDGKRPNNVLFSPLCIGLGIGMAYIGAENRTKEEIYRSFYLGEVQDTHLLAAYAALHWDVLRSAMPRGYHLEAAIRLFAQTEYKMTNEYEEILINYEISRIRHVDFLGRVDLARLEINKWVEDHTHGKIQEVLPLGYVDKDTKLFLVVALYFKPQWYHPFDTKQTYKLAFHLPMKETIEVVMMNQQNTFRVGSMAKLDTDVIVLPFLNTHIKMYVFLPHKMEGCKLIEQKLTRSMVETMEENLQEDYIDVFLPKFRYEQGLDITNMLQKVGIKDLFKAEKADLQGIDGSKELYIYRTFHHMCFEVDETGSDSSSASSGPLHDVGIHDTKPKRVFKCDRPFVFLIRDERTGAILVMGRVVRPSLHG